MSPATQFVLSRSVEAVLSLVFSVSDFSFCKSRCGIKNLDGGLTFSGRHLMANQIDQCIWCLQLKMEVLSCNLQSYKIQVFLYLDENLFYEQDVVVKEFL